MSTADQWKNHDKIGKEVEKRGEEFFAQIQSELKSLKPGTLIAINVANGEYVVGESQTELMAEFRARFGPDNFGWIREVTGVRICCLSPRIG